MSSLTRALSYAVLGLATSTTASPFQWQKRFNAADFQTEMINGHNFYRYQHGAANLTWNDDAAANAQAWVNTCASDHQPNDPYGEDLAWGNLDKTGDYVNMWGGEREQYDWNNPGFSGSTGHFTQVVWVSTNTVGCAWNDCNGQTMVSCEYDPPGNYDGEFGQNVLPQVYGQPSDRYQGLD